MLSKQAYVRIMKASAWYDLVVTAAFMTPWTFVFLMSVLGSVDAALGIPGEVPLMSPTLVLLGNLMGSVVIVWSVLRLHLGLAVFGRYDAVARVLFAAWQINAVLNGASWLVLVFVVAEVVFGILQALPYAKRDFHETVQHRETVRSGNGPNGVSEMGRQLQH